MKLLVGLGLVSLILGISTWAYFSHYRIERFNVAFFPVRKPQCVIPEGYKASNAWFVRFLIPQAIQVIRTSDADYFKDTVKAPDGTILKIGSGLQWSPDWNPQKYERAHPTATHQEFQCWEYQVSDFRSSMNGKQSRLFVSAYFTAEYKEATSEAAALFDSILDSHCCFDPNLPENYPKQ